jgi:hypothetical protein
MKKISLTLPAWARERNIYVFAGVELVALSTLEKPKLRVKDKQCNWCGKCCMNVPDNWPHGAKDGNCVHLDYDGADYKCALRKNRPFACCASDDSDKDFCCVTWKEAKK